mmetsp:Transcript_1118/g.2684  ORF Transcript_1118/g.2684 Transcript_1118/m.2684 type:complete len:202 (-) Transcript_1118:544-1149(-)
MSRKICSSVHCVTEHSLTCSPACASASWPKRRESADAPVGTVKVRLGGSTSSSTASGQRSRMNSSSRSTGVAVARAREDAPPAAVEGGSGAPEAIAAIADWSMRRSTLYPWPYRDLSAWMGPTQRMTPSTITPSRAQRASHSSMLCVVSTVQHARVRRWMTDQRKRFEPASMPELGSSRSTSRGLPTRAMPTQSLRLLPPE